MSKCRYDLSEDCNNTDCLNCVLGKIRSEFEELRHYYPMGHDYQIAITRCLAVIDKYKAEEREQIPDTRRIRILPPENILKLKEYAEWLPQYEGEWVAESEESMIRSRQMANKLSQNIIEHARRLYPEALGYKGQLTNEQFCEIEKECDIDFYKFGRQDPIYKIRYKGGDKE